MGGAHKQPSLVSDLRMPAESDNESMADYADGDAADGESQIFLCRCLFSFTPFVCTDFYDFTIPLSVKLYEKDCKIRIKLTIFFYWPISSLCIQKHFFRRMFLSNLAHFVSKMSSLHESVKKVIIPLSLKSFIVLFCSPQVAWRKTAALSENMLRTETQNNPQHLLP